MQKILAIDDKKDNLVTLSALLKNLMPDCVMITAQSGMEGIDKARIELPDVILLDVVMPDMDGFETCRRLTSDERTGHIPVIMITAIKTDSRSRTKGMDIGANSFLAKPIDEYELVSQLKVALRIKRAEDALREERKYLEKTVWERTAALQESEERFRLLIETTGDMIYNVNRKGFLTYVNPTMAKTLGYLHHELEGQSFARIVAPECIDLVKNNFKRAMNGESVPVYEMLLIRKDGTTLSVEFNVATVYDREGNPAGRYGIGRDVTDRRQAIEERQSMEKQLFQAQKMEAIGTLAGGIAHDFNNILGAIIGYTELALDEDRKERRIHDLQEVLKGAERAGNLVKQILSFSRQDNQEKKPLDIKILLKEAIKFLRASIPATIEIHQDITADTCNILADPTQIYQVIMNLVTNAAYAMKKAGGVLKMELSVITLAAGEIIHHPDLSPGPFVKLSVSDTGHGIDPAHINRIFDPFFTTKDKGEGTGLGLSVVYGIVKSHDGVVNVYSEPEKGATFNVYLPGITHSGTMSGDKVQPLVGGTERIIFVDDEHALVDMGRQMLSSLGYNVTGAMSSTEALVLFRAEPARFDLVITDMTMPKMTGIDLAREILKIRPDIPIILCSGISESDTEVQAQVLGIRAYCLKPLTKRNLSRVIRETLDKRDIQ
jgi:PAS domain S-box-containing protein